VIALMITDKYYLLLQNTNLLQTRTNGCRGLQPRRKMADTIRHTQYNPGSVLFLKITQ